jgi:diguanylate cyclase (GGDEF)-like protein
MTTRQRILVIDDDPMIHKLVAVRLQDLNVSMECATDGTTGIGMANSILPDLILLDVGLPDMSGFSVFERLRDDPFAREIPTIFLTGSDQSNEKVRAFKMGAVDYVTKPFDAGELVARVRSALRIQALMKTLEIQALSDRLTRLPNREAFSRAVARCIERVKQSATPNQFAVMFLDLDRFKVINDSLGHAVGDELLVAVANRLYECVRRPGHNEDGRHEDLVARLGGDEFAILLHDVRDESDVVPVAERIQREVSRPQRLSGHHVTCGVSIGIRMCDNSCAEIDGLLRDSDTAMYHAKLAGKGQYAIFDGAMREKAKRRMQIEGDLHQAVQKRQFRLVYQPIMGVTSNELHGFEALVRWDHPEQGVIPPDRFISIAEETGVICDIGRWVLHEACIQCREWSRRFGKDIHISVNLSKAQLHNEDIVSYVDGIVRDSGIRPEQLVLEITESDIMHDSRAVVPLMQAIRNLGIKLAMDDFGTGYSSLASLHRFPLDYLKIDREFVQWLSDNRPYAAIVHAIITLAHNLGLMVVAEGVESNDQFVVLQTLDCDLAQGSHLAEPLSVEEAECVLKQHNSLRSSAA